MSAILKFPLAILLYLLAAVAVAQDKPTRSEEHTSELQSPI